ncbi:hypothetical protein K2D_16960 [Planctomycetes bacterium K2D]|nr:hypothetical protein K2D_16960 [Planctomycetes bacterium K2D]
MRLLAIDSLYHITGVVVDRCDNVIDIVFDGASNVLGFPLDNALDRLRQSFRHLISAYCAGAVDRPQQLLLMLRRNDISVRLIDGRKEPRAERMGRDSTTSRRRRHRHDQNCQ